MTQFTPSSRVDIGETIFSSDFQGKEPPLRTPLEDRLAFLEGQRLIFQCMARDESLHGILTMIANLIERETVGMLCSVLLLDGEKLRHGAAPSLPDDYTKSVDGITIGAGQGSCGTAAALGQQVVASDVSTDPNWSEYAPLAERFGLKACWSTPIFASQGTVLGTFACYHREPHQPTTVEMRLVAEATSLAGLAIEKELRQRALKESEERFRLVAEVTNSALWFADLQTGSLFWSQGFASVFGHAQQELSSTTAVWMNFLHPEDRDRVVRSIQYAIQSGANRWSDEYRFQRGDGTYASVMDRAQIIQDPSGKPLRMLGGMSDLSEHLDAVEQIAEQSTLLDQASDAIIVRDLEHRVLYWNRGAEKIYGWTLAEVRNISVPAKQQDLARFEEATRITLEKGSWAGELDQLDRQGKLLQMQCRWTLLRDRLGAAKSILAINTDITEKKVLEAQFLRAQRMESIGTLASGIAHDLNNVLTPITMGMELLRLHTTESSALGVIAMVESTAKRGAEMIGQVLSFARGLDGQRHFIKPGNIAREVSRILKDTLPRNIRLTLVGDQGGPTILGDATQLHQVLVNLCVNARDAMPTGGEITVAVDQALDWPAANPDGAAGPCVRITVSDTGTGIPAAVRERIFEPFFTTKEIGKGTGLGLATVQAIIRSHGGMIEVASELGLGTSFIMWLPIAAAAATALEEERGAEVKLQRGKGETILVVDDEESLRSMARQTLEAFGYKAITATDGADAIRLYTLHQDEIAVVLTDMMMPIMDGVTAVQALKAMNPQVKVIAATGMCQDDKLSQMQAVGVTHFLPKPFPTATMLKLLHELINTGS